MAQTEKRTGDRGTREIVAGTAEIRAATIDIVLRAQRALAILTPNLEPDIYEHADFLDALKRFVLAKSFARVRVLITEPERAIRTGNQFVQMGQRLNSYIEFRNLHQTLRPEIRAYCISDTNAVVYRANQVSRKGMVATHASDIAKLYLSEFDELWQAS
jgi:hypothetical protein